MSRVLEALKQFEQVAPQASATPTRVTPRLTNSVRKAVLGASHPVEKLTVPTAFPAEPPVLFRVPSTEPTATPSTRASVEPKPDPLALVDAIAESIRSADAEEASQKKAESKPSRPASTHFERHLALDLLHEQKSRSYRQLYEAIVRDTAGIACPAIGILSIDDEQTTSQAAAAIATLVAQEKKSRVLLVDTNSCATLSVSLEVAERPGLVELINGKVQVCDVELPTSNPLVDFITRGRADDSLPLPTSLGELLKSCRERYSAIFLDAGSMQNTWAVSACRAADAIYVAVNIAQTSAEVAVNCVKRLRAAGVRLAGSIVIGE